MCSARTILYTVVNVMSKAFSPGRRRERDRLKLELGGSGGVELAAVR